MWCPVVQGLVVVVVVEIGLVVVKGESLCPGGGTVVVGDVWRTDFEVELLGPDGVVEGGWLMSSQDAAAGAVDAVEGAVVLGGDIVLVAGVMVGPVVEEDQPGIGVGAVVRMVVPVEVHLGLGGILGDAGVEEEEHGVEKEELVDMDGTCLVEA